MTEVIQPNLENLTDEQKNMLAMVQATQVQNQNMQKMQQIVRQMKEIPELPSEVPKDVQALTRVEFPEQGGVHTYMEGFEHPYKGFPFFEFVEKIDTVKKIQRATLSSLFHSFKARPWYQKVFLLFVPWLFKDLVEAYILAFHRIISRFRVKRERYSDAMRELHQAFSFSFWNETEKDKELRFQVRDILCMVLEFDNAYRYRFQDIIVELDKESLRKNPSKELVRLLNIMQTRETTQEIKDSWTLIKRFLPLYLRCNRKLRRTVIGVLSNVDLEKIALDSADQEFCAKRTDYKFGFQLSCQHSTSTSAKDIPPSQKQSLSVEQTQ